MGQDGDGARQNHVEWGWKPFSLAPSCSIAIPNLQPKDLTHCPQIPDHATNWHCPSYKNQVPVPVVAISLFGRSQDQRIAPTWTNKSHPFRHTQIRRLISQIQLQNPSLRIWMLPNQFQSEVSTICTKSLEKFYLLTGEEIEVKESLKGHFLFPIWIYFPMINYQLFQKLNPIKIQEFSHLTIILTFSFTCETKLYTNKWGLTCEIFKYFKWEVEWKWESNSKLPILILW